MKDKLQLEQECIFQIVEPGIQTCVPRVGSLKVGHIKKLEAEKVHILVRNNFKYSAEND